MVESSLRPPVWSSLAEHSPLLAAAPRQVPPRHTSLKEKIHSSVRIVSGEVSGIIQTRLSFAGQFLERSLCGVGLVRPKVHDMVRQGDVQ